MDQSKKRSKLPAVTALLVGFIMFYCDTQHLCYLQSPIVEALLLAGVVLASYLWTARAKTSRQAWRRMGLAFLIAIAIEMAYLLWLHSDFFPRALLSPAARQRQEERDEMREAVRRQQGPGDETPKATQK
jgi:hypothetical protein